MYAVPFKFMRAQSFAFSAAFPARARIRETCLICKQAAADSDGTAELWPKLKITP